VTTGSPLFGLEAGALRRTSKRNMAVRFAFGAVLSIVAGVVGVVWGPLAGGLLLAFPAILPATLTLIENQEGERSARDDDDGAALGALGLAAFAFVAWRLHSHGMPVALAAGSAAWLLTGTFLYLLSRLVGILVRAFARNR
jgi:hypothetical protein